MKQTILVTGGTGYIGSHTVVELQNAGYNVIIVDNLSNSSLEVIDNIEKISKIRPIFYNIDITDTAAFEQLFIENKDLQAIIHFAAYKAVGESVRKPLKYYHNNLIGLINVLKFQIKYKVKSMVFSSSCTVYGQPDQLPVTEKSPKKTAESPYGNTKQVNEEIIHDTLNAHQNLNVISLRYFNPIGAHPSALIGELPLGVPENLVPYVTQTAAGLRDQLSVFGDDYNTPDGSAVRDYINVVDLAKAHVIAIGRLLEGKNIEQNEIFNLGTGEGLSVLQIVNKFQEATGESLNYKIVDRRAGDVEQIFSDTTKANEILGWKAETTIEETLISAWNWEKRIRNIE